MSRSISLLLSRLGGPPYQGSVGYVNNAIAPIFGRRGWEVRPFHPPAAGRTEEAMLPFGLAELYTRQRQRGLPDIALYDDAGTALRSPSRRWAKRNVVLYHGLVYSAGTWMTNPDIDLHCANSPYLARVLQALFAFPDWQRRRCLEPDALNRVTDVRLPLPCVAEPDGSAGLGQGSAIPMALQRALDGNTVFGHALQSRKQDWVATLGVMRSLNALAKAHGTPAVKLLVSEVSLDATVRQAMDALLAWSGDSCEDFFIPVPHLNQPALFRLMRACRFGLAYNRCPESFGFYVLESVHNGCPVYTNGAGNNRFLLPPDHGIVVRETPAMAAEMLQEIDPCLGIAQAIHADLAQPEAMRERCRRGAALIDRNGSMAAFEHSLLAALERLEQPSPEIAFDRLEVRLSPLVRSLDLASGHSLNDYASSVLEPAATMLLRQLIGRRCGDLDSAEMERIESQHGFFRRGLLTLVPPVPVEAQMPAKIRVGDEIA
jgi:hypothetical protein